MSERKAVFNQTILHRWVWYAFLWTCGLCQSTTARYIIVANSWQTLRSRDLLGCLGAVQVPFQRWQEGL